MDQAIRLLGRVGALPMRLDKRSADTDTKWLCSICLSRPGRRPIERAARPRPRTIGHTEGPHAQAFTHHALSVFHFILAPAQTSPQRKATMDGAFGGPMVTAQTPEAGRR